MMPATRVLPVDSRWIGLTALAVLFGLQCLRALLPLAVFMLRDRFGWHAATVGLAMSLLLATGFLVAPACRALGRRRFLWLTAGGLALARLALQAWTGDPLGDLGLAACAGILFLFALPALAAVAGATAFVLGWLVGLAADTALHGAYGTWDMSWRSDVATLILVLVLAAVQWRLLAGAAEGVEAADGERLPVAWTWAAFGPLLFLEMLVLGNVARLAALTGWDPEQAALWVLAGRVLALAVVALLAARGHPGRRLAAVLTLALAASFSLAWPRGAAAALLLLAAQALAAVLWSVAIAAGKSGAQPSGRRLAVGYGLGLQAFGALLFLYYGGLDVRLPISRQLVPPLAALGLGAAAFVAARSAPARAAAGVRLGRVWLAVPALLLLPLARLAAGSEVRAAGAAGLPLKVMTYNLHLGIDPRGHLGLERVAATIEAESPDVVALQEVPRGWLITGSADVLGWLSRRLGMAHVFAPTTDPLWGNAVLSRRPILDHQAFDLPPEDLLIRRGFLAARIGLEDAALRGDGRDGALEVIVTHHHHLRDGGAIREQQSRAILDFWGSAGGEQGRGRTAIVGDFNGRPGDPEIEMLRAAGLADVLDLAGVEPGYTFPSYQPIKRIDYIWISPDLAVSGAGAAVPPSPASDHLPVVATLDAKGRE